jgi:hypothetical protein
MRDQLDHLLSMAQRPNVIIQVIDQDHGAHGAMSGPLCLLAFPEDDESDSAYVESIVGNAPVEGASEVAALAAVWDEVAAVALPADRSADLVRSVRNAIQR